LKLARPPRRSPLPSRLCLLCRRSRQLHSRIIRIGEYTRLACWFESLAGASHPLQRRPRRNYLIPPRRARSTRSLEIRRFPQIQIYKSGKKEIRKWGRGFETCSAPALTRCYPRSFAFYLGNPFPRFCVPALTHVLPPIRPVGFPIYVARRPAAPFTRLNCPCPICVDPWLTFLRAKKAAGIFFVGSLSSPARSRRRVGRRFSVR